MGLTINVLLGGDHSALLEELVRLGVHHQKLGLVPARLDGRHHVPVLFPFHADPVHLRWQVGVSSSPPLAAWGHQAPHTHPLQGPRPGSRGDAGPEGQARENIPGD